MMGTSLVVGFGVTGRAVARALLDHDETVVVVEDSPTASTRAAVEELGVALIEAPSPTELTELIANSSQVLPSPGVPWSHPVFALAEEAAVPIRSEFDLAARWDHRPIVAITGTDGKTTVTTLVTEMLEASGIRAIACGNTETPLVAAITDPSIEVFVVEASSFRLASTERFDPLVAVWLNIAPDHLDSHASMHDYVAAKARVWSGMDPARGSAVANALDPVVMANRNASISTVTFGPEGSGADATVVGGDLCTADGIHVLPVDELPRSFPHDITNALAAMTAAFAAGATLEGVRRALRSFGGLAHRVQRIGSTGGVEWYDDSKATTPHAVLTAIAAFRSVVLVAGGRNKGLDLSVLGGAVPPVRAVVAMGESAREVAEAFAGRCPVRIVTTDMRDVVTSASELAEPGDVVLLSPACASFDWFGSYAERGDAFADAVRLHPDFVAEVTP